MADQVMCPIHKKPITLEHGEGGRMIGICRCDEADVRWYGHTVYEITKAPAVEKTTGKGEK